MVKLIESIGRWGIAHHVDTWILCGFAVLIVIGIVWDIKTTKTS